MHLCFNSQQYYMIINGYIYDIICLFDPAHETLVFIPRHKVWRGIMLYPSVSVRPSVRTISDR